MKNPVMGPFGEYEKVVMNPGVGNPNLLEPAAKPDPEVSFIAVKSISGKPIALLANYSLHYVGGVPVNDISADYFAVFADRIQELMKADRQDPPFVGIMSNGTSGDVNNIDVKGPAKQYKPYEKMHVVANDVAAEVMRVNNNIKFHDWVRLQAAQDELTLKLRKADQKLIERSKMVMSRPDSIKPAHIREALYAGMIVNRKEWPDNIKVILQAFRIGDLGIAAIPFETFSETGIEIKAQPPGKKLQSLSLMSGGERALTAIALLFAVLRVKPSPFYVLDEIDAALDEHNIEKFGRFMRHVSDSAQFIVITHQKRTMEAADVMYGVTMQESGVSKIISVRLSEKVG
jgi:hypothetical protein